MFVRAEGGAASRPGFQYVRSVKDSSQVVRLIPFEFNEEQAYALEFGDRYMRVVRNGGLLLEAAQAITGATQADPVVVMAAGHGFADGDEVFVSDVAGMTALNRRFFIVANATANSFALLGEDGMAHAAYMSGGAVARVVEVETPYTTADLPTLKFRQSNDVLFLAHRGHAPRRVERLSETAWRIATIQFQPTIGPPTNLSIPNASGSGGKINGYVVTAFNEETGEESVAAANNDFPSTSSFNEITWSAVADATQYNIYKDEDQSEFYGYIGSATATTFSDRNVAPDLTDTPALSIRNPFGGPGDYPGAVGLHEQRAVYGNTDRNPLNVYFSQTGQFNNFNISSPTKEADAITQRLVTGQGNEIRHFRSFVDQLFAFTSGAVWTIRPGGDADAITASSKKVSIEAYLPSTDVPPILIKENILMVSGRQNQGFEVHSLGYTLERDGYQGSDLTILARHLFEGRTIREWAYADRPFRLVCAVRDDGDLVVMTYLQEQQIFAWSRWETDGAFESVCSVPEGQEDVIYAVVRRTIDGADVRYIERLSSRLFDDIKDATFADSFATYDGPPTKTVDRLDHLEGETVIALADGSLIEDLVVTNGAITLKTPKSRVHVGLSYTPQLLSVPLNSTGKEPTLAQRKTINNVVIRVDRSRGFAAGPSYQNLDSYPARSSEPWGAPATLQSDIFRIPIGGDWKRDVRVAFRGTPGLPFTLLSMVADTDVGD